MQSSIFFKKRRSVCRTTYIERGTFFIGRSSRFRSGSSLPSSKTDENGLVTNSGSRKMAPEGDRVAGTVYLVCRQKMRQRWINYEAEPRLAAARV